jgi:hypothetical protein
MADFGFRISDIGFQGIVANRAGHPISGVRSIEEFVQLRSRAAQIRNPKSEIRNLS